MSLNLLLHVKGAKLDLFEQTALVVKATVNGESKSTGKLSSLETVWNEDLNFQLNQVKGELWIELLTSSQQSLLGLAHLKLYTIRHSNNASEGQWYTLIVRDDNGVQESTSHMINLDVHFELPKSIPLEELELLEKKLSKFQNILENEISIINKQYIAIKTKSIPLPDASPGKYAYPDTDWPALEEPLASKETLSVSDAAGSALVESPSQSNKGSLSHIEFNITGFTSTVEPEPPAVESAVEPANTVEYANIGDSTANAESTNSVASTIAFEASVSVTESIWFDVQSVQSRSTELLVSKQQIRAENHKNESGKTLVDLIKECEINTSGTESTHETESADRTIDDKDLKMLVYNKTLQALVYPDSTLHAHSFVEKSFRSPTHCVECEQLIWRHGMHCQRCGKNLHKKCAVSAKHDCFHIRDSITSTVQESHIRAITTAMNNTLVSQKDKFELLRKTFSISEVDNSAIIDEVTSNVIDLAKNFSATIKVKVLSAQGLVLNPVAERSIYVSIDVGGVKAKTNYVKDNLSTIQWQEEFEFECSNYLEPVNITVWNEKHSGGKRKHKKGQEGDLFLGQKVIEVLRLGAPHTLWYKLDKRTDNDIVSGSIQLNLSSVVSGETVKASYYDMYSLLHEQLFLYTYIRQKRELVICSKDPIDDPVFLPDLAQAILDEFASRYAVESFYRSMVHLKLLIDHSSLPKCYTALNDLLTHIKQEMFMLSAEENIKRGVGLQVLVFELLESSNFGRLKLIALLEKLIAQLLSNLLSYHDNYVEGKNSEIEEICQLMKTIAEFQQAVGTSLETRFNTLKLFNIIDEITKMIERSNI